MERRSTVPLTQTDTKVDWSHVFSAQWCRWGVDMLSLASPGGAGGDKAGPKRPVGGVTLYLKLTFYSTMYNHPVVDTSHSSPTGYICSFCQKSFGRSEHLNRHVLIHTKERSFSCATCNKEFSRRYDPSGTLAVTPPVPRCSLA